jgi:vacuolar-type H+-ATPase subunit E/Vma4
MPEYRTPEEEAETAIRRARIQLAIDKAMQNAAAVLTAMTLEEPPQVVDLWVDKLWNDLRNRLSDEERLTAIVMLIQSAARDQAKAALKGLADA